MAQRDSNEPIGGVPGANPEDEGIEKIFVDIAVNLG